MKRLGAFRRNDDGNLAVITALSLSVLLASVGMAIDMGGATSHKAKLQAQVDAAVLAAAAGAATTKSNGNGAVDDKANNSGEIKKRVKEFVQEDERFTDANIKVKVTKDVITVNAESEYNTMIMGMFGKPTMETKVTATAPRASQPPVDIALVLDTTRSMEGANMDALRSAALSLVDDVEASLDNVRISLVPYGDYVNIGTSRAGETWLQATKPDEFVPAHTQKKNVTKTVTPPTCIGTGVMTTHPVYADGILIGENTVEQKSCSGGTYETVEEEHFYPAYTKIYEWSGCAGSRTNGSNTVPAASASDKILGALHTMGNPGEVQCGTEMIPLTNDFDSIRNAISGLTTSGSTYLASGLIWGWRALDPSEPFQEAATTPSGIKAVIFMTDGGNMRSQNAEYHNGHGKEAGNMHTMNLCDGIKNSGITLYTVAYDISSDNQFITDPKTFLRDCASSSAQAYSADNVFELKASFTSIVKSLKNVRLSR